jgi:CRP-like cAMP-binding protein
LEKVDGGRKLGVYRQNQKIFSQGEAADAVIYIQKGMVKLMFWQRGKD